jgi:hypothetical protein
VTRIAFTLITKFLEDTGLFTRRQLPIEWQIHIVMYRLGHSGTGSSIGEVAQLFRVSEGSVFKTTGNILNALYSVCNIHVYWLSAAQKRVLVLLMEDRTGITGTWGPIVDGTDAYFLYTSRHLQAIPGLHEMGAAALIGCLLWMPICESFMQSKDTERTSQMRLSVTGLT